MFKILVVEDDAELNRQVCNYLRLNGYETTGCLSANDAFNEMYGTMFDMIISDIMMPGIIMSEMIMSNMLPYMALKASLALRQPVVS